MVTSLSSLVADLIRPIWGHEIWYMLDTMFL